MRMRDIKEGMHVRVKANASKLTTLCSLWDQGNADALEKYEGKIATVEQIDLDDNTVYLNFHDGSMSEWDNTVWLGNGHVEKVSDLMVDVVKPSPLDNIASAKLEVEALKTQLEVAEQKLEALENVIRIYSYSDLESNAPSGVYQAQSAENIDDVYRFYVNASNEVFYITCGYMGREELERAEVRAWQDETFAKVEIELVVTFK